MAFGSAGAGRRLSYGLREDLRLFVPVVRAEFFASVSAVISLVLDTSFFDCWIISASFAFTRLVISLLSPVLGMCPPYEIGVERFALRAVNVTPSGSRRSTCFLIDAALSSMSSASDLRSIERSGEIRLSFWA